MLPIGNDLCIPCTSLVGGGPLVIPHPELRRVENSVEEELFHCVTCDAWWDIRKLGWGRVNRPLA
jgi:hypothetical protein